MTNRARTPGPKQLRASKKGQKAMLAERERTAKRKAKEDKRQQRAEKVPE